jgi:lysozyme
VKVPLTQNQFDALYSLCFNIGEGAFKKSTVVKRLNANDYKGAADAILMWNKPSVLEKRRKRERDLFLSDI